MTRRNSAHVLLGEGPMFGIGRRVAALAALAMALVTALAWAGTGTARAADSPGAVYTLTNEVSGNRVAVFDRTADGVLSPAGTYATGGTGTGSGLGSQGALVLSEDNRLLFAVNAGSNDVSSFRVRPDGLELVGRAGSGGVRPVSIAVHSDLLYVLNAGGSGGISGFTIGADGRLFPIAGSSRPLSSSAANAAQVSFSPDGRVLIVTERATQTIDSYVVGRDGRVAGPMAHASSGAVPFGFAFDRRGRLFVSEAAGSALSSYDVRDGGDLELLTASLRNGNIAACWTVVTGDGRFAYTANAGTGTISGYRIALDGTLTLVDADGRTGVTGSNPTDMAITGNSRYLYVLTGNSRAIHGFRTKADGGLTPVNIVGGLVAGSVGIAAR
jgi:6-phosphogluconolactonase